MPDWGTVLPIILGTALFAPLLSRFGFLGMDWLVYFTAERFGSVQQVRIPVYPPWVFGILLYPITIQPPYVGLAILNGLTLSTLVVLTYRYARYACPESRLPASSTATEWAIDRR